MDLNALKCAWFDIEMEQRRLAALKQQVEAQLQEAINQANAEEPEAVQE